METFFVAKVSAIYFCMSGHFQVMNCNTTFGG